MNTASNLHLNSLLVNEFYLAPAMISTLEKYYLMHWEYEYFREQITPFKTIIHQDTEYIVVMPLYLHLSEWNQLRLSFRKPYAGTGINPHVLVRLK